MKRRVKEQKGRKENEEGRGRKRMLSVCSWVTITASHLVEGACVGDTRTTTDNLRCRREYWTRRSGSVSMICGVGPRGKNCEEGACWLPPAAKWTAAPPFY